VKIDVASDKCIGAGLCAMVAPEVFDQSTEKGTVVLLTPTPDEAQAADVREAAHLCPSRSITVRR
jgi:ferredoxin